jgi:hypothetical protein
MKYQLHQIVNLSGPLVRQTEIIILLLGALASTDFGVSLFQGTLTVKTEISIPKQTLQEILRWNSIVMKRERI